MADKTWMVDGKPVKAASARAARQKVNYTNQRLRDEKKAKGGDKKAKLELAEIEQKRALTRGKSTPSKHAADNALRRGPDTRGSGDASRAINLGGVAKRVGSAMSGLMKPPDAAHGGVGPLANKGNATRRSAQKAGNGSIGTYSGPKPRAYSSLSAAGKAKEDRQNERDMATKKNGAGK